MNRHARESAAWTQTLLTDEDLRWLTALPIEHVGEDGLVAVHGAPQDPHRFFAYVYELTFRNNLSYMQERGQRVCFYAHTHVQFVHRRELGDGDPVDSKLSPAPLRVFGERVIVLVNPGSVGQPRDGDSRAAYALWNRETNVVMFHRVEYSVERTIAAIERAGLPRDLALRLEIGR